MKFAVCAIARNELPYINEWVAYQKYLGFDDIYIYDNNSDDGTSELLVNLNNNKIINRVFWPRVLDVAPQRAAYADFLEKYAYEYDWVFICDLDEFLYIDNNNNVKNFVSRALMANSNVSAIAIPWLIFGSAGQQKFEKGLVIERFKNCNLNCSRSVKTLFKPSCVYQMRTHIVDLHQGQYLDNSFNNAIWSNSMPIDLEYPSLGYARVHHYYTKSYEEWSKRKSLPKADRTSIEYANIKLFNEYNLLDGNNSNMDICLESVKKIKSKYDIYCPQKNNEFEAQIIFSSETILVFKLKGDLCLGVRVVLDDRYEILTKNFISFSDGTFGLVINLNIYTNHPEKIYISSLNSLIIINLDRNSYPTRNFMLKSVLKYLNEAEYIKFNIFKRLIKDSQKFQKCAEADFGSFIKFPEYKSIIDLQKKSFTRLLTKDDVLNHFSEFGHVGRKVYFDILHNNSFFREGYDFLDEFKA